MRLLAIILSLAFSVSLPLHAIAEEAPGEATAQQQLLSEGELDALVAPIALYPDALLTQVLMASTYPLEVVQADRWAKTNKSLKGDKLEDALVKKDWDASIKALVTTPTVLAMMNDDLEWTEKLGDAVLSQQADVMDAIQRLRSKAEANGKLKTTKEQKVTVTKEADNKQVIVIEPSSPETVYVPYYEPSVVYGSWDYPDYPPYYFEPAPGYVLGGAIATGIAWGAAFAIGNAVWDNFDWRHGNINVDIDKNYNFNRHVDRNHVKVEHWQHNAYHRRGVSYSNREVQNKFAKAELRSGDRKLDYRGRSGEQVLNPDRNGPGSERPDFGSRPGEANRPGFGKGPGDKRPDIGGDRGGPSRQAALGDRRPDLGKSKPNAFDARDGAKARDYSKRGQASLGNRSPREMARPKGGGKPQVRKGGGPRISGGGGGGRHVGGGGGGGTSHGRRWSSRGWRRSRRRWASF